VREIESHWHIGAREEFGIEFTLLESSYAPFGYVHLFVKGLRIGRADDPVFIYSLLLDLEWIVNQPADSDIAREVFQLDTCSAWDLLQSAGSAYRVSPIEFFDGYEFLAVRRGPDIRFLWTHASDLLASAVVHDRTVARDEAVRVVREFRLLYERLRASAADHKDRL
jgi:hypothetical protein